MPVLFKEISDELGLDLVQIGATWAIVPLASIAVMPIGGLLCDRFGIKSTMVLTCFLAGLTGALRGLSSGIVSLLAISFVWSILISANIPAINMAASLSFSKQRQGLSQGFVATGGGIGYVIGPMISATLLSPWLGGWRNVLFLYGGISIIFGLLWLLTVKEPERAKSPNSVVKISFRQAFSHLFRIKAVWFIGLIWMCYLGCVQAMIGFLPYYLRGNGWPAAAADGALATFSAVGTFFTIPLAILSDRIGSRKLGLYISFITAIIGVGLLSVIHNEIVWILVIVPGIFTHVIHALIVAMCLESKEIEPAYMGTAAGLVTSIAHIGWVTSPPIGNSLANISFGLPFVFWAAVGACGLVFIALVKETGWRASTVIRDDSSRGNS